MNNNTTGETIGVGRSRSQRRLRVAYHVLVVLAVLWVVFGLATHIPALKAQVQAQEQSEQLQTAWDSVQPEAVPAYNQAWATISIPAIGLEDMVVIEGTDSEQINVGVGHYTGTEFPWDGTGNVALAGHRTGWGQPFHELDELIVGDAVIIETAEATYTYTVTGSTIVDPSEVWVLEDVPTDITGASGQSQLLTLTTCEGEDNEERLIVWAELAEVAPKG